MSRSDILEAFRHSDPGIGRGETLQRTADPVVLVYDQEWVICDKNGTNFMLAGAFTVTDHDCMFLITVAHPPLKPGDPVFRVKGKQRDLEFARCVLILPDYIKNRNGVKYTSDIAILKFNAGLTDFTSKIRIEFQINVGGLVVEREYQLKLFRGELVKGTSVLIKNQHGETVEGHIHNVLEERSFPNDIYYNVIQICDANNGPVTAPGDSGSICFLKPNPGDTELQVFGMAISRDGICSYFIRFTEVVEAVVDLPEFNDVFPIGSEQGKHVEFCQMEHKVDGQAGYQLSCDNYATVGLQPTL